MDGNNRHALVKKENSALVRRAEQPETFVTVPLADIYETESTFVVRLDMPGAAKASISVSIESDHLRIKGTMDQHYEVQGSVVVEEIGVRNNYVREFQLGKGIDYDGVEAGFDLGVLTVTLPKTKSLLSRQITIR